MIRRLVVPPAVDHPLDRLVGTLLAMDGPARVDLYQRLAQALESSLMIQAAVHGLPGIRIGSSWCRDCRTIQVCRIRPVGVQVVICHRWDDVEDADRILAAGNTLVVIDPVGGEVRRRTATSDRSTPLSDGVPVLDCGIGVLDYAACVAANARKLFHAART